MVDTQPMSPYDRFRSNMTSANVLTMLLLIIGAVLFCSAVYYHWI